MPREPEREERAELTAENIQDAFERARGNLTRAAELLGVHKATLYRHMKQLDISREGLEETARQRQEGDHE